MKILDTDIGFKWTVSTNGKDVEAVVALLIRLLEGSNWARDDVFSVHTALVEAINNSLEHGNRFDQSKKIFLSGKLVASRLVLHVRDEGSGFDTAGQNVMTHEPSPLSKRGRGIFLIRNLMSNVRFNELGNELIMEKIATKVG